jgi:MFS family permease
VSCLSVSSAVLGPAGTKQSALLFGSYTASALLVATPVTQTWGPKSAMTIGMALACLYIASFVVASAWLDRAAGDDHPREGFESGILGAGAVLGGIGAGILWTASGVYLARAAEAMSEPQADLASPQDPAICAPSATPILSNQMAGWFAFFVLLEETILEALSSILVRHFAWRWTSVFGVYATLAVLATCFMQVVHDYDPRRGGGDNDARSDGRRVTQELPTHAALVRPTTLMERCRCDKLTLALRLLIADPKSKYLIGLPLAFGFTSGFFISFVSGQVVPVALHHSASMDESSSTVN